MKTLLTTVLFAAAMTATACHSPKSHPDYVSSVDRAELAASDGHKRILPSDDIEFAHNSDVLLDAASAQVDTTAGWMKKHKGLTVVLEGHANSIGNARDNETLAMRRAEAVRERMMELGVPSDRIMVVVFGESGSFKAPASTDRRVVMYATDLPPQAIVRASLENGDALAASWTRKGVLFTQTHDAGHFTIATR